MKNAVVFILTITLLIATLPTSHAKNPMTYAVEIIPDLPYNPDPTTASPYQTLDLYRPVGLASYPILLFVHGGPSQLETYDLKPDGPEQMRSVFRPIATRVPGMSVCELLPLHARVADRFSLIRSLHHKVNIHNDGSIAVLTGRYAAQNTGNLVQAFEELPELLNERLRRVRARCGCDGKGAR